MFRARQRAIPKTRLRIEHRTTYIYSRPVEFGRHKLVLRPREGHDLHVESMKLKIAPAHHLVWSRDVFGNSVAIVDFIEEATQLEFYSDVIVRRSAPFPEQEPHEPWRVAFPVVYDSLETTIAVAYQAASFPDDVDELQDWLDREFLSVNAEDAEGTLFQLGTLIFRQIKYQRRSERGVQTPAKTLSLGSGSCRDMATLMMDAARLLGVAARFASGYLDCLASEAGYASTHAWTEIYLPSLGWRGYDPTLGQPTSLKHVVTGVSNHPRGVMPISGMFTGVWSDYRDMTATVKIEKIAGDVGDALYEQRS